MIENLQDYYSPDITFICRPMERVQLSTSLYQSKATMICAKHVVIDENVSAKDIVIFSESCEIKGHIKAERLTIYGKVCHAKNLQGVKVIENYIASDDVSTTGLFIEGKVKTLINKGTLHAQKLNAKSIINKGSIVAESVDCKTPWQNEGAIFGKGRLSLCNMTHNDGVIGVLPQGDKADLVLSHPFENNGDIVASTLNCKTLKGSGVLHVDHIKTTQDFDFSKTNLHGYAGKQLHIECDGIIRLPEKVEAECVQIATRSNLYAQDIKSPVINLKAKRIYVNGALEGDKSDEKTCIVLQNTPNGSIVIDKKATLTSHTICVDGHVGNLEAKFDCHNFITMPQSAFHGGKANIKAAHIFAQGKTHTFKDISGKHIEVSGDFFMHSGQMSAEKAVINARNYFQNNHLLAQDLTVLESHWRNAGKDVAAKNAMLQHVLFEAQPNFSLKTTDSTNINRSTLLLQGPGTVSANPLSLMSSQMGAQSVCLSISSLIANQDGIEFKGCRIDAGNMQLTDSQTEIKGGSLVVREKTDVVRGNFHVSNCDAKMVAFNAQNAGVQVEGGSTKTSSITFDHASLMLQGTSINADSLTFKASLLVMQNAFLKCRAAFMSDSQLAEKYSTFTATGPANIGDVDMLHSKLSSGTYSGSTAALNHSNMTIQGHCAIGKAYLDASTHLSGSYSGGDAYFSKSSFTSGAANLSGLFSQSSNVLVDSLISARADIDASTLHARGHASINTLSSRSSSLYAGSLSSSYADLDSSTLSAGGHVAVNTLLSRSSRLYAGSLNSSYTDIDSSTLHASGHASIYALQAYASSVQARSLESHSILAHHTNLNTQASLKANTVNAVLSSISAGYINSGHVRLFDSSLNASGSISTLDVIRSHVTGSFSGNNWHLGEGSSWHSVRGHIDHLNLQGQYVHGSSLLPSKGSVDEIGTANALRYVAEHLTGQYSAPLVLN